MGEKMENVIDFPVKLVRVQEKRRRKLEEKRRKWRELYGVDRRKATLIIACKRSEFNHYNGQRYPPGRIPLVSEHWTKSKYINDYFMINSFGKNPSILSSRMEDGPWDFSGYGLSPEILQGIKSMGYKRPTLIQHFGIRECLVGRNTLLAAETGSGKTLAYAAPLLHFLLKRKWVETEEEAEDVDEGSGPALLPRALVIAPGRELANQIFGMIKSLAVETGLKIGEVNLVQGDRNGGWNSDFLDVLVGTPGALKRMLNLGGLRLDELSQVVVDEADSLLKDSFGNPIIEILSKVHIQMFPPTGSKTMGAQLILASATFPTDLGTLLEGVVDTDNLTRVTSENLHRILPHVPQKFWRLSEPLKQEKLLELVRSDAKAKRVVLVFCRDPEMVEWVWELLKSSEISCGRLHGKMSLADRQDTFAQFQAGRLGVLVCTDIGSRGLDTASVDHVINYDFARDVSSYIHRVGRVGRVGSRSGCHVTSFIHKKYEVGLVNILEEAARKSVPVPNPGGSEEEKPGSQFM